MDEAQYDHARQRMVDEQIRARGVRDPRLLAALEKVPRHLFVPEEERSAAYHDYPLPIGFGQTISQPYVVALMTDLLGVTGEERVLEVGTGSGYQAAVLAELCREVVSLELVPQLAERAQRLLNALGYDNVTVQAGDGSLGYPPGAPYDVVLVTAAAPKIAEPWVAQLAEGGRLLLPLGDRYAQYLVRVTVREGVRREESFGPVAFVPLLGENGWGRE